MPGRPESAIGVDTLSTVVRVYGLAGLVCHHVPCSGTRCPFGRQTSSLVVQVMVGQAGMIETGTGAQGTVEAVQNVEDVVLCYPSQKEW